MQNLIKASAQLSEKKSYEYIVLEKEMNKQKSAENINSQVE
jgi:hypothetical protein